MEKLFFVTTALFLLFASCKSIESAPAGKGEAATVTTINTQSFPSKKAMQEWDRTTWTGIIAQLSFDYQGEQYHSFIHDFCSGLYCPQLYIYRADSAFVPSSSYSLVFHNDYTAGKEFGLGNFDRLPTKMQLGGDRIMLTNREDSIIGALDLDVVFANR